MKAGRSGSARRGVALAVVFLLVGAWPGTVSAQDCGGCGRGATEENAAGNGCGGCGRGSTEEGAAPGGCGGCGRGAMARDGSGPGAGGGRIGGGGPSAGMRPHHDAIQFLLDHHAEIERTVEPIDGGVRTVTLSTNNAVVDVIREHVRQMQGRLESGHGMRHWDPLFVELFEHHDAIRMEIDDVPGGVEVRETSTDPAVTALIRQHAERAVTEFVTRGRERAGEPTPLPEGYGGPAD